MGVEITTNYGPRCPHGFFYSFGCDVCAEKSIRRQAQEDDALSVLRELVAMHDVVLHNPYEIGSHDEFNDVWARARELVERGQE